MLQSSTATRRRVEARDFLPDLKRKRTDNSPFHIVGTLKSFTIKPCPSSPYDKPHTLTPVTLLPRAALPLAFLGIAGTDGVGLGGSRLFTAYIEELQSSEEQNAASPMVLVAKLEASGSLYAIERVKERVYALCKLGDWVKSKDVIRLAEGGDGKAASYLGLLGSHDAFSTKESSNAEEWWRGAAVTEDIDFEGNLPPAKRPRLSMGKPATLSSEPPQKSIEPQLQPKAPSLNPPPVTPLNPPPITPGLDGMSGIDDYFPVQNEQPVSAHEALETLVTEYLKALYTSKTSLAYFAKGPLSRARAAFSTDKDDKKQRHHLASFLRTAILTQKMLDRKWKEKIPAIVKAILPTFSDDEQPATQPKKSKKKKLKLSNDGMFPTEEEYVKRWWKEELANYSSEDSEETGEAMLKKKIANLRVRENFAQLILTLEVMALEASPDYKPPEMDEVAEGNGHESGIDAAPKKRKKKIQDMTVTADLLVDKLCIWQSLEGDAPFDFLSNPTPNDGPASKPGKVNDRLRSFSIEVIIPFYMSRLPDFAASINKKLGGPSAHSPPKKRTADPAPLNPPKKRPGETLTRPALNKRPRQPLGRVATDTSALATSNPRHPSLARSATDSFALPHIKREASLTPSLKDIPLATSSTAAASSAAAKIKRMGQRSVDFVAMSAASQAKIKRKKEIEDELKNVIGTLKKPNRNAAVKEFADTTDQRRLGGKKSVLVTATPKKGRNGKFPIEAGQPSPAHPHAEEMSEFAIPSSSVRPAPGTAIVPGSVLRPGLPRKLSGVAETPSRGSSKMVAFADTAVSAFKLPLPPNPFNRDRRQEALPETPVKTRTAPESMAFPEIPTTPAIFATPQKPTTGRVEERSRTPSPSPERAQAQAKVPVAEETQDDGDIYKALGWDDDYDI